MIRVLTLSSAVLFSSVLSASAQKLIVAYDFEGEVGQFMAQDKAEYTDDLGNPVDLPAALQVGAAIVNDGQRGDVLQTSSAGQGGFGAITLFDDKLNFETSFTLQAWLKTSYNDAFNHLVGRPGAGPRLFSHHGLGALGAAQRDMPFISGFEPVDFGPGSGPDNQWHHALISWNHTDGNFYGYWDGINGNSDEAANLGHGILGNSPNLAVGCPGGGNWPINCPTLSQDDLVPSSRLIEHDNLIFSIGGNPFVADNELPDTLIDDVAFWNGFATAEVAAGLFDGTYSIFDAPIVDPSDPGGPLCDVNGSGACDGDDLRMIYDDIAAGTNGGPSDIDGSGTVDNEDIPAWLTNAGTENGEVYLEGDTNLDGEVGGVDFTTLAFNFGNAGADPAIANAYWEQGNFDGNGVNGLFEVGGPDFTSLALNFGNSSVSTVPEPGTLGLLTLSVCFFAVVRRR